MDYKESFKLLSEYSELAKQIRSEVKDSSTILHIRNVAHNIVDNTLSFHPNGKCGCIEVNDDYMFGIRCNHLMWAEGYIEGTEPFTDDCEEKDVILVYGNHKGYFLVFLLYTTKSIGESVCVIS